MLNKNAQEFISCLMCSRTWGFNDFSVLTHAWHESGGFREVIGLHNYWGIKKPKKWTGLILPINTHEYIRGRRIAVTDYFIDFPTCEQAILWYCHFIEDNYKEAYFNRSLPPLFFKGLMKSRFLDPRTHQPLPYATDPKYVQELNIVYLGLTTNKDIIEAVKNIHA